MRTALSRPVPELACAVSTAYPPTTVLATIMNVLITRQTKSSVPQRCGVTIMASHEITVRVVVVRI